MRFVPVTEQLDPSVQVTELMVIEGLTSAELGIGPAATDNVGVVVEVATDGTSQEGHDPADATKLVTDPLPVAHAPFPVVQTGLPKSVAVVLDKEKTVVESEASTTSRFPGSDEVEPRAMSCQLLPVVLTIPSAVPAVAVPEKIAFWLQVQAELSKHRTAPEVPKGVVAAVVKDVPLVFRQVMEPTEERVQSPIRVSGRYTEPT